MIKKTVQIIRPRTNKIHQPQNAPSSTAGTKSSDFRQQQQQPLSNSSDNQPSQPQVGDEDQSQQDKLNENFNPLRSLADAAEQWQRRLQIFERNEEDQNQIVDNDAEDDTETKDKDGDEVPADVDNRREFEFVKDEEKHEAVGLADTMNDDQKMQQDDEWKQMEHQQKDEEEGEAMQVDEPTDPNNIQSDKSENPKTKDPQSSNLLQSLHDIINTKPRDENEQRPPISQSDQSAATLERASENKDNNTTTNDQDDDDDDLLKADAMDIDNQLEDPHLLHLETTHGQSIEELRKDLEDLTAQWQESDKNTQLAISLWQHYQQATHDLSMMLTEQLRLVLAPTLATQLKGDYRTGKRLNMKRIIPYIASQFKKDKIWLRRTKPSRRQYQVMIAVDDSKSMAGSTRSVELAYEALALITSSLNHLEVGQMSVVSFGEKVKLLHPFDQPFDNSAGARVLQQFRFDQDKTNVKELLSTSLRLFEDSKASFSSTMINPDLWQLQLIISDGVCEDHFKLKQMVRSAVEQRVMMVFVVIDQPKSPKDSSNNTASTFSSSSSSGGGDDKQSDSIMNIQRVCYETDSNGRMVLKMDRYLDTFPFDYYVVLRDIQGLPTVLADALRQYFSLVGSD